MEKRSNSYRTSIIVGEEFEEEPLGFELNQVEPQPPTAGVWLKSNYPGNLITTGIVTGNQYKFLGGGSVVQVDASDAPGLLEKVFGGNSCCGSGVKPTHKLFVVEM